MLQYHAAFKKRGREDWPCASNLFSRFQNVPFDGGHTDVVALWCSKCGQERPATLIRKAWNVHRVPDIPLLSLSFSMKYELFPDLYFTHLLPWDRSLFAKWNAACYFTLCMQTFEAGGNLYLSPHILRSIILGDDVGHLGLKTHPVLTHSAIIYMKN